MLARLLFRHSTSLPCVKSRRSTLCDRQRATSLARGALSPTVLSRRGFTFVLPLWHNTIQHIPLYTDRAPPPGAPLATLFLETTIMVFTEHNLMREYHQPGDKIVLL